MVQDHNVFIDLFDPKGAILDLTLLVYIFKQQKCTIDELLKNFHLQENDLKVKIKRWKKHSVIDYLSQKGRIKEFNKLIIQSSEQLGYFFKEFYEHIASKEVEDDYIILDKDSQRTSPKIKKNKDFTIRATPKLAEYLSSIEYIVKSTEKELRERGYL